MKRHGLVTSAALALTLLLFAHGAAPAGAQTAGRERVFRGSIGDYPVRVRLVRGAGGELTGSYSYEGREGELTLKGTINEGGEFTLDEYDGTKRTGTFKGQWREKDYEPEARLDGEWTKPGGGGQLSFGLSEELVVGARLTERRVKESNNARHYKIDAAYPLVEGAVMFNRLVEDLVRKQVAEFKQNPGITPPPNAPANTLDINYSMRLATDELVSVQFTTSRLEYGMAHSAYSMRAVNYDLKSGRQLSLADLFRPGSNYLQKISSAAVAVLEKVNSEEGGMYLSGPEEREGAAPKAENYRNWTLTTRGLAVTFEPYQVGAFAAGAPEVLIPYSELKQVLRPDGPLASLVK